MSRGNGCRDRYTYGDSSGRQRFVTVDDEAVAMAFLSPSHDDEPVIARRQQQGPRRDGTVKPGPREFCHWSDPPIGNTDVLTTVRMRAAPPSRFSFIPYPTPFSTNAGVASASLPSTCVAIRETAT